MSVPVIGQVTDEILKMDGTPFDHEIETFDIFFDEIGEVNEVNKAIIEYKGTGTPNLTIEVGIRSNQNEALVYSAAISQVIQGGSISFFFRKVGVGKYMRFRFRWQNTELSWIDDIRIISLTKVEDNADIAEK